MNLRISGLPLPRPGDHSICSSKFSHARPYQHIPLRSLSPAQCL